MELSPGSVDVIFVSYDEPQADAHYFHLQNLVPWAKRIHGVLGIANAYRAAGELSTTDDFFMIDGDTWVMDSFPFKSPAGVPPGDMCLWNCRNAVNGHVGLNGAVKRINRANTKHVKDNAVDYFGSMPGRVRSFRMVAGENRFNSSSFSAWRAAFRECAKLAGGIIRRTDVTQQLNTWQTRGGDKPHGVACILGARLGATFGASNWESPALRKINDPAFLQAEYARMLTRLSVRNDLESDEPWSNIQPVGSARISLTVDP